MMGPYVVRFGIVKGRPTVLWNVLKPSRVSGYKGYYEIFSDHNLSERVTEYILYDLYKGTDTILCALSDAELTENIQTGRMENYVKEKIESAILKAEGYGTPVCKNGVRKLIVNRRI